MTTIFPFTPTTRTQFQFAPTLDGQVYNAFTPWSLFGKRFYLNLVALDGTPVLYTALAGSPDGVALQTLSWARGLAMAVTDEPHGYKIAKTVMLTILGATPNAYNGLVQAFITGPNTFSYPLANDPGPATVPGSAIYNINLVGGLFDSTLVFRESSQQFEVSP